MSDLPLDTPSVVPAHPSDDFLTKKELAVRLKVTVRTVESWQRRGILVFVKVGRIVRFSWSDVVANLKTNFQVRRSGVVRPRR